MEYRCDLCKKRKATKEYLSCGRRGSYYKAFRV